MTTLTPEQTALLERMRTSFADKDGNGMEMNDHTLLQAVACSLDFSSQFEDYHR
jgi:hypothetical protein